VIADLIRIEARQAVAFAIGGSDGKGGLSSLLGMGLNAAASYFGGPAGSAAAGASISGYTGADFSKWLSSFDGGGFTGIGPRAGGMDGKGGFLAMLHPQETVVDHSKGQSAGGPKVGTMFGSVQFNFPGITDTKQARQATATASRQLAQAVQGAARYM
jgi:hypothetical protein